MTNIARDLRRGRGVHLGQLSALLAARYGTRAAVEDPDATPGLDHSVIRTFVDVEEAVARLAAVHARGDHADGRRVLVLIDNRIDVLLHVLALARAGALPVPVNARLTPAEVTAIVEASGATAAVADPEALERLRAALDDAGVTSTATDGDGPSVAATLRAGDERLPPPRDVDADAPALLLATSGTTGAPKAAVLTSRGLTAAMGLLVGVPVGRQQGLRAGRDRVLASLPLTHVMGLAAALGTLCAGVELVRRRRFDVATTLDLIEERRPNVFVGVPTMYADLEAGGADDRDLSSIQLWVSSADAMPPDRARRFQGYGSAGRLAGRPVGTATFLDVYGMVELSGAAATRVYPPSPSRRVTLPAPSVVLPGRKVRAVDDDGRPVRAGQVGELQFSGGGVLRGYETASDGASAAAGPDAAGWFATGDLGRVWPGGVFQFAGRSRDRIKVGGFSVFPAEVETQLRAGPGVTEVALVGVPDDRLGERPVALVVAADGFDPEGFLAWAGDAVAGYRRPQDVHQVEELPRGNHGKLDRAAATELATSMGEA